MINERLRLNSYLSFKLGKEIFAANVGQVLNILEMTKITEVPKAPNYMKGVINLRGKVLPVIDTRIKFGLSATEFTPSTCILVLEVNVEKEHLHIGALVDAVQEVLEIGDEELLPAPTLGNRYRSEFITGMYKLANDNFIMLLDMDNLFNVEDLALLGEHASEL